MSEKYEFTVTVKTAYLPEQSNEEEGQYVFSYTVTIVNTGAVPAQLISRHWIITDDDGHTDEVKGLGVVGDQPLLAPNQRYEYTSGTVLNTPSGAMHGTYQIVADDGTQFEAEIPAFTLAVPRVLH